MIKQKSSDAELDTPDLLVLIYEQPPFCDSCNEPFTVKHFLITCIEFHHIRTKYFNAKTINDFSMCHLLIKLSVFLKKSIFLVNCN